MVVITKEEEERNPHPLMGASTGELVRRLRETLPPYQQKRLSHIAMPGMGRKAQQLNWALRPAFLREILGDTYDPAGVFVGVSDADSVPDPDTYRCIAHRELSGQGSLAYQGIPLSERSHDFAAALPDRISIYRGPLVRDFRSRAQIRRQIRLTVVHEIAHFFGLDERRIRRLGY